MLAWLPTLLCAPIATGDPNWSRDVAPILFQHCVECHRPGEVGPFSLLTSADAAAHAKQIARVTSDRTMPPWLAEPSEPPFVGARRLSDDEIATLKRWAESGAPEGDPKEAPTPPNFTPGWQLGTPDLVLEMPEPFVVPADGVDLYRNFVIPVPVATMKYVRAIEFRPGAARVVHHAVIKLDKTELSRRLDAKDPLPGFEEMEQGEAVSPDGQFLGWTPGRTPRPLPDGMCWRLPPDSDLVIQLHLLPQGRPEPVRASVGLFFTNEPPKRLPFILRLGCQAIDIPAGARDYELADEFTVPVDVELSAIAPHAHFLGTSVQVWATPAGGVRRTLLDVKRWNFSWQDEFRFATPLKIAAGTKLSMLWRYDNGDENPRNPRHPPARVFFGPSSLEEMCDVWIQVIPNGRADFDALQRAFVTKDLAMLRRGFELKLARNPDDAPARFDLGLTLFQQQDFGGAKREFARAVELAPQDVRAHFQFGTTCERLGELDAAKAQFEEVVKLEPDQALAMNELGIIAESGGDAAAAEWYERAAKVRPKLFVARVNFGRMLERSNDYERAEAEFEAALALDPNSADVKRRLAWWLATAPSEGARNGRRAVDLARELLGKASDDPELFDLLAVAQAEAGRFKAAIDTATRAIELARSKKRPELAEAIEQRLAGYQKKQPWRAPAAGGR